MVTSAAEQHYGSWLSYPAQMRLPNIRGDFDVNRDPHIAAEISEAEKTESERRALLVKAENAQGLKAQRDAAFQRHQPNKQQNPSPEPHYVPRQGPRFSGPSM